MTESEKQEHQIVAGIMAFVAGHELPTKVFAEAWKYAQMPNVIKGPKWAGVGADGKPHGHRHDQSILSILTSRNNVVRYPLDLVYCDYSLRRTFLEQKSFYVHRGAFTLHKQFLPGVDDCYVINLERRPDRLEKLFTNCPELEDVVQRVVAVDGLKLKMTPAIARLFRPHDFGWKKPVLGCALSHLRVWWQLANEKDDINSYLILEDDVKFKPGWQERWIEASEHIPEDFDVIYLGGILPPNRKGFEDCKVKVNPYFSKVGKNQVFGQQPPNEYFHWCNYSYILSKTGARKVLEVLKSKDGFWTSGDHMVCNLVGILKMYFLDPLVSGCYQDDDPKYQASAFNDFSRIDGFDSDLWNNNERFPLEETNRLANQDVPLDIVQALKDSLETMEAKPTALAETKVGSEAPQQSKEQLKKEIQTVHDPLWKQLQDSVNQQAYGKAVRLVLELLETWQEKWWSYPDSTFQWMVDATQQKQIVDLPSFDDLDKGRKVCLIVADSAPDSKRKWIETVQANIQQLSSFRKRVTEPPKSQKRRILTLQAQALDVSQLYEMTWIQELLGPQEPLQTESVSLESECPKDSPIVLIMRPWIGEWMKIFQKWKSAGSTFYVIHLSDEHVSDPISFYGWDECLGVVRNYWREELEMFGDKVVVIPLGYHWTIGKGVDDPDFRTPRLPFRENLWSFYGSDWNGRRAAMKNLEVLQPFSQKWFTDFNDPEKFEKEVYLSNLMNSKFVPAPGGMNPETYRFYEALECGCIPLYVRQSGDDMLIQKMYAGKLPLIDLPTWDHAVALMFELTKQPEMLEAYRHNILLGWKLMKKDFASKVRRILNLE